MNFGDGLWEVIHGDQWWQIITLAVLIISAVLFIVSTAMIRVLKAIKELIISVKAMQNSPPKDYKPQVFAEADVMDLIRTIKHDTHADRVSVMQFHNGEKSIANNPFLKFSCTHENLSINARSAQKYMMGLPISIFGHWIRDIFDHGVIECYDLSKLVKEGDMRGAFQLLSANGSQGVYLFPLENAMGRTFGFGMIEYTESICELDPNMVGWAEGRFKAVGVLLSGTTYS